MQANPYWPPVVSFRLSHFWCGSRWNCFLAILLLSVLSAAMPMRSAGQALGPLVVNPINDTNILLGTTLTLTVSVTNTVGISANSLHWTLPNGPSGPSITNSTAVNTALFTWQPTTGTSTNNISVQVQDQFNPTTISSTSFRMGCFTNAI